MRKLFVFVSIICLCCFFYSPKENKHKQILDLTISNIECLAQNEGGAHAICYGSGSVDCRGLKVKTMYSYYK